MAYDQIKKTRFELRCSEDELREWRELAKKQGLSLSAYIRVCLNKKHKFKCIVHCDPNLIRQISAIGNNLNQIAYWTNVYKSKKEAEPVEKEIKLIRKALDLLVKKGVAVGDGHVD